MGILRLHNSRFIPSSIKKRKGAVPVGEGYGPRPFSPNSRIQRLAAAVFIGILAFFELCLTSRAVWAWGWARRSKEYGRGRSRISKARGRPIVPAYESLYQSGENNALRNHTYRTR